MKTETEVKCLSCVNAIIIETGLDLAGRHKTIFCGAISMGDYPVPAPREVVQCSSYTNRYTYEGRDLNQFIANAVLVTKGSDGKIIKLGIVKGETEQYMFGHKWAPIEDKENNG